MIPISICIIAKNEASYLHTCLTNLAPHGFELIIVDTGSNDNTIEVASTFTKHVYSFDWIDDFSAARNYSIAQATNDWILIVDCDEHLTSIDVTALTKQLYSFDPSTTIGYTTLSSSFTLNQQEQLHTSYIARFFSKSYFHYSGIIHEQIVPLPTNHAVIPTQANQPLLPLTFFHEGYRSNEQLAAKSKRNIALLEAELEASKPNDYTYFQLGQSYFTLADYPMAIKYFELAFEFDVNPEEEYVQTMVSSYGYSLINLKRSQDALCFLEAIYHEFSDQADFLFLMGLACMNNALFEDAITQFKLATTHTTCSVEGTNSYNAYYNIGVIYECTNRIALAREFYEKAGDYPPALTQLQQLST